MPDDVKDVIGYALHVAQQGATAARVKPLHGFGGAGVLEIIEDHDGNTYRAVYTVRFRKAVYVLHAFQKKSTRGIRTTQRDLDLIRERLRVAERHYEENYSKEVG